MSINLVVCGLKSSILPRNRPSWTVEVDNPSGSFLQHCPCYGQSFGQGHASQVQFSTLLGWGCGFHLPHPVLHSASIEPGSPIIVISRPNNARRWLTCSREADLYRAFAVYLRVLACTFVYLCPGNLSIARGTSVIRSPAMVYWSGLNRGKKWKIVGESGRQSGGSKIYSSGIIWSRSGRLEKTILGEIEWNEIKCVFIWGWCGVEEVHTLIYVTTCITNF